MGSIAAKAVANDVLKTVESGGTAVITKIAPKRGYSIRTAQSGKIQKTKSYLAVISPVVQRLEIERDRAIQLMAKKISKAKYRDLTDSVDKLTKNIQLLTGGSTANVALGIKRLSDVELERIADSN